MLLLNLIHVTESISGPVVPLAMFVANFENSSKHWFRNMQTTLAKKLCWDGIHGNYGACEWFIFKYGAMMIQNIKNNCQCRLPQNMSREIWEWTVWWILKTFIYAPSPKITKYSKGFSLIRKQVNDCHYHQMNRFFFFTNLSKNTLYNAVKECI